jgi:hypothetical protein
MRHHISKAVYIQFKCLTVGYLCDARQEHGWLEEGSVCPVECPQIIHEVRYYISHTYGLHPLCRRDSCNVSK